MAANKTKNSKCQCQKNLQPDDMESGFWANNAPVGLRFEFTRDKGNVLVPDQPNADIIKEAFEGYASGRFATQAEVARFMGRFPDFQGNKNGKVKQHKVMKILTNPIYAG